MKKPFLILIGITLMFCCVLLGIYFGRNSSHNYITVNNTSTSAIEKPTEATQATVGKININTASEQQLTLLPGIGEAITKRIVDYRTEHGDFAAIEDIMNVSGIGEKKFEQLKEYIVVE